MLSYIKANWKTTSWALILPMLYAGKHYGIVPESVDLPPLATTWPFILAIFGIGITAKDLDVTGGDKEQ